LNFVFKAIRREEGFLLLLSHFGWFGWARLAWPTWLAIWNFRDSKWRIEFRKS
jgi:hypothetical protein